MIYVSDRLSISRQTSLFCSSNCFSLSQLTDESDLILFPLLVSVIKIEPVAQCYYVALENMEE
jgi:hypothetical protein